jgi:hypothetical protein
VGRFFGRKKIEEATLFSEEGSLPILSQEVQVAVGMEQALLASMELVMFHKDAWNELVSRLAERGVYAEISEDARGEYEALMGRLRACLTVVAQESKVATELTNRLENND